MISCSCDFHEGVEFAGYARFVTCRTPRKCDDCSEPINKGDGFWIQNQYDRNEGKIVAPYFMCEECGDLIVTLADLGYCFYAGDVKRQWKEYLDGQN